MSKIYDALSRGADGVGDVVRKIVSNGKSNGNGSHDSTALRKVGPSSLQATEPIRVVSLSEQAPVLVLHNAQARAAEQYRMIRTKISQHPSKPRSIAISSGNPGDGKTFNAINLAATMALRDDARVVLVDGDLRRSSIAKTLGITGTPGLSEVLSGKAKLRSALVQIEQIERLYVLPAGEAVSKPGELLDSPGWRHLVKALTANFGFVIIDAPPVAAVADYEVIQDTCDGVILVVRQDHSNRTAFMKALASVGTQKRLGVILNSAADDWLLRHSAGYYYGDYDAYYSQKKP